MALSYIKSCWKQAHSETTDVIGHSLTGLGNAAGCIFSASHDQLITSTLFGAASLIWAAITYDSVKKLNRKIASSELKL